MKRVNLFLTLLIVSIAALITATIIGFALFSQNQTNPYNWMSQMWGAGNSNGNGYGGMGGGMMGGSTPTPTATTSAMLPYYGALFAVLIALVVLAVVGISYYLVYPQIRMGAAPAQPIMATQTTSATTGASAYESVSKTLTEDERKIITVLQTHNGKYLQKYIKAETELSRLQTHRILARLAERGMVSLEKTGNTNQVVLADWLTQNSGV
jgi:predicted transcriptional regulator